MKSRVRRVRALVFDVFGTVVDWRGSVIREGRRFGRAHGIAIDWGVFADAWRGRYHPSMQRVRTGELPWTGLDALHRASLDALLGEFGIAGLPDDAIDHLNRVWHRLAPWPDARRGLRLLRRRYTIATLSNGNVALLTAMAKHSSLPWDCILSAELFRHYKPDPEVYTGAATLLGLAPGEVMMVAAHHNDLEAARACGLATAFVSRPLEFGRGARQEPRVARYVDVVAGDFVELAARLGEIAPARREAAVVGRSGSA
jgi:2-haloacid dehalogenase